MYQVVDFHRFQDAFTSMERGNNFTYTGLRALFNYLIQFEEDIGEEIKLDVIALCCEYAEATEDEFRSYYPDHDPKECEHVISILGNGHILYRQF